ncbi:unnamed protein product [Somion occarium]|uniref:RNA polymerase II-associated protein 3 n=1 Tax=Somion occarium TaxID=3059160 RepID=A0ABP1E3H0_9APHY
MTSEAAQISKDKGNTAFKAGDYPTAIGHYSAAIVADAQNPTLPLNRAAAYLKLGKNEDAERDCSRVIGLNQNNVKAWFRRAQARAALEKYGEALTDLKQASKLDPINQDVNRKIVKTEELLKKKDAQLREKSARRTALSQAAVPNPPPHPARRRVPITIVEPESSSSKTPVAAPASAVSTADDFLKPVSSRPLTSQPSSSVETTPKMLAPKPAIPAAASPPLAAREPKAQPTSHSPPPIAPLPKVGGGIFRPSGKHTIFGKNRDDKASTPTTLVTFMKIWDAFQLPEQRWAFIQQIAPASLPAIFKSSLEPSTLVSILQTFNAVIKHSSTPEDATLIKEYMTNLARVPRWSTIVLFLGADEKKLIAGIWNHLSPISGDEDANARKAWGLT